MKPARRVLLVEGPNDRHVLWALLEHHKVPESFHIEPLNGIDRRIENARVRLKAFRTAADLERLGIILDADADLELRWGQLQDALRAAAGITLPASPDPGGTLVPVDGGRMFGVWVMPDNQIPGMLEDFLAFLVPPHDALLPHVDGFLGGLPSAGQCAARFPDKNRIKARIHAWLSVQLEPGKPLGQAITARYLDADAPKASALIGWLRRLFVDPVQPTTSTVAGESPP